MQRWWLGALMMGLVAGTPAWAADWDRSFPTAAAETYVQKDAKVLVAAGGKGARAAATALRTSLAASSRVALAMDDSALGDLSSLDDASIVSKASALPVDVVGVVRVFDGTQVVVTFYDLDGTSLAAMTGKQGEAISAQSTDRRRVTRDTSAAARSVTRQSSNITDEKKAAFKEMHERGVFRSSGPLITGFGTNSANTNYRIGFYGSPLKDVQILDYVGATKEAKRIRGQRALGNGLLWGGVALVTVAPLAAIPVLTNPGSDGTLSTGTWVALGTITGVSLVAIVAGPPVRNSAKASSGELRRYVDQHNQALMDELGLTQEDLEELAAADRRGELRLDASPMVWSPRRGTTGGGVRFRAHF